MSIGGTVAAPTAAARGRTMPRTLEFLMDCGVPAGHLAACAREAERTQSSVDQVLLRWRLMDEEAFYRALAGRVSAPFLREPALAVQRTPAPASAAMAPLASADPFGSRFAIAPHGAALELLLERVPYGKGLAGAAITTPTGLARGMRAALQRSIAYRAANALPDARPDLSFRGRFGRNCKLGSVVGAVLLAALAAAAPAALDLAMAVCGLVFLLAVGVRLAALWRQPRIVRSPAPPASELPVYTVLAPLLREARVLPQLLAALEAIDYPPSKLDIKLLIEERDHETLAAARAAPLPDHMSVVVCPAGPPLGKPRALNIGLAAARGELLAIYDAEDAPDPKQLRAAAAVFMRSGPELACLQAQLSIYNHAEGWLQRLFALEYAALFRVLIPGYAALGLPIPLGGTSNHFRVAALRRELGWDAWNVTEDADLGLRLALRGYRVGALPSVTHEEAVMSVRAWLAQRTRWQKGWMQTTLVHARALFDPRAELSLRVRAAVAAHTLGLVLASLLGPWFLLLTLWRAADGSLLLADSLVAQIALTAGFILPVLALPAIVGPIVLGAARAGVPLRWRDLALYPLYLALMSAASWRALWELFVAPQRWNKTEHGLSRPPVNVLPPSWREAPGARLLFPQEKLKKAAPRPWRNRLAPAAG